MTRIVITPGQKLMTHGGQAFCRLGILVEDGAGAYFGLTARHILEVEEDDRIYDAASSSLVGKRIALPRDGGPTQGFFETIGAFKLDDEATSINFGDALTAGLEVAAPEQAIGRPVYKAESQGRRALAQVIGYGGSISLVLSEGESVIYHDVLELTFDSGVDPVGSGDAGSLILDQADKALGLMIAGDRRTCYIAPLLPFLDRHRLRPIDAWERLERAGDEDATEALSSDYRGALAGAEQMRAELREEAISTPDPEQEIIPDRLLDLLESD